MSKREEFLAELEADLRRVNEANAKLAGTTRRAYNWLLRVAPGVEEG